MRVSVIVPVRNAAATLPRALAALARQDLREAYEVLVVDNGSDDGSADIAEQAGGPVRVVRQENLGPAAARNRGAALARGTALAFTDADCYPEAGWLRAGLAALEGRDLVQGGVRPDPEARRAPFDRTLRVGRESGLYETANLFVSRETFERLGGFESVVAPTAESPFGEDVWFGWRVRRLGGETGFSSDAVVHHAVFPRGGGAFARERLRLRYFPAIVARIPELREEALYRRYFLSRRTAAFDVAGAGAAAAVVTRSRLPLLAAVPYGYSLLGRSLRWRGRAVEVAAIVVAADAIALGALAAGSMRARTPVL